MDFKEPNVKASNHVSYQNVATAQKSISSILDSSFFESLSICTLAASIAFDWDDELSKEKAEANSKKSLCYEEKVSIVRSEDAESNTSPTQNKNYVGEELSQEKVEANSKKTLCYEKKKVTIVGSKDDVESNTSPTQNKNYVDTKRSDNNYSPNEIFSESEHSANASGKTVPPQIEEKKADVEKSHVPVTDQINTQSSSTIFSAGNSEQSHKTCTEAQVSSKYVLGDFCQVIIQPSVPLSLEVSAKKLTEENIIPLIAYPPRQQITANKYTVVSIGDSFIEEEILVEENNDCSLHCPKHMEFLKSEARFITDLKVAHSDQEFQNRQRFKCYICLETYAPPSYNTKVKDHLVYNPFQLSACGHTFCKNCITPYLHNKINEGNIYPTCCFPVEDVNTGKSKPCGIQMNHIDIAEILDEDVEMMNKYTRYKFDKEHPFSRRCPKCDTANIFEMKSIDENNTRGNIPVDPIVNCNNCSAEFCYHHSGAHVGRTCEQYERDTSDVDGRNAEFINTFAKKCPECSMLVQKLEGCNQMKCPVCNTSFCWLCLEKIDDGTFPIHFQWWNLGGCPNMQLNESIQPSKTELALSRGMSVIQIILIAIPSAALAVVTFIPLYCIFHILGTSFKDRAVNFFSLWGNVLTVLLLIPLVLVAISLIPLIFIIFTVNSFFTSNNDYFEDTASSITCSTDEENQL